MSVECRGRTPVALLLAGQRLAVHDVLDQWLIEDEWWRAPVARRYFQLALTDGRMLTVFQDGLTGCWYAQRYAATVGTERRAS